MVVEEIVLNYLVSKGIPLLEKGYPTIVCITIFFILLPIIKTLNNLLKKIGNAFINSFTSLLETAPKLNTALERIAKSVEKIPQQLEGIKQDLEKSNKEHKGMIEKLEKQERDINYIKDVIDRIVLRLP